MQQTSLPANDGSSFRRLSFALSKDNTESPQHRPLSVAVEMNEEQRQFTIEQVAAMLLGQQKEYIYKSMQQQNKKTSNNQRTDGDKVVEETFELKGSGVAYPLSFSPQQIAALHDAAKIAQLPQPLYMIPSLYAVAVLYAISHKPRRDKETRVLLVDVGHAHASAAIFRFNRQQQQQEIEAKGKEAAITIDVLCQAGSYVTCWSSWVIVLFLRCLYTCRKAHLLLLSLYGSDSKGSTTTTVALVIVRVIVTTSIVYLCVFSS